jgi:hypothetical protein
MSKSVVLVCLVLSVFTSGCFWTTGGGKVPIVPINTVSDAKQQEDAKKATADATKTMDTQSGNVKVAANTIDAAAGAIKVETAAINNKLQEPSKGQVQPNLKTIDANADAIAKESQKLDDISSVLAKTSGQLASLNSAMENISLRFTEQSKLVDSLKVSLQQQEEAAKKEIQKRDAKIVELESSYTNLLQKSLVGLILFGTVLIAVGIALGMTGNVKAFAGAVAGGVLVCVAMAVKAMTYYGWLFGLAGGIGFAVLFGSLVWYVWDYIAERRKAMLHKIALDEAIETVEVAKTKMTPEAKVEVFGDSKVGVVGVVDRLQSLTTKDIVSQIKSAIS